MKANWPYLAIALLGFGAISVWMVSIAPPHLFSNPKFYLMVVGELAAVWTFSWLMTRKPRANR